MEEIKAYIEKHELSKKSRKGFVVMNRYYMYAYIKYKYPNTSNREIAELFGRSAPSSIHAGLKTHNELISGSNKVYYMSAVAGTALQFPMSGSGKIVIATPNTNEKMVRVKGDNLRKLAIVKSTLKIGATYEDAIAHIINNVIILK